MSVFGRGLLVVCVLWSTAIATAAQSLIINGVEGATSVPAGSVAVVSISSGPGNPTDWMALYPVGASDGAYIGWQYLNGTLTPPSAGVESADLAFLTPVTPGAYEFRLFANNTYVRVGTSGVVTVTESQVVLGVNGASGVNTTVVAGTTIALTVAGGPGNPADWIALAPSDAAATIYSDWRYLNGTTVAPAVGLADASVSMLAPVIPGVYEFRLFVNGTNVRLASSGTLTVVPSPASLTVNGALPPDAVPVAAGTPVALGVLDGPANPGDWVGLFASNAPDPAVLTWHISTAPPAFHRRECRLPP